MVTTAIKTQGIQLKIENEASPNEFTLIGQIDSISDIGSGEGEDIDITNFDSLAKEYLQGLPDEGSATFGLVFNPDNVLHERLINLRNAQASADFKLTFPSGTKDTLSFTAFVKTFAFDMQANDAVRATVTLRITGLVTLAAT